MRKKDNFIVAQLQRKQNIVNTVYAKKNELVSSIPLASNNELLYKKSLAKVGGICASVGLFDEINAKCTLVEYLNFDTSCNISTKCFRDIPQGFLSPDRGGHTQ